MSVDTIIKRKKGLLITGTEHEKCSAIAHRLAQNNIGVCLIVHEDAGIAGIISERDIVRAISKEGPSILEKPAKDLMTTKVYVCSPDNSEIEAMNYMLEHHIRHLPVVENRKVVGLISLADVVQFRLRKINLLFEQMEKEQDDQKRLGLFTQHLKRRMRAREVN